jgi:hypothetical protein
VMSQSCVEHRSQPSRLVRDNERRETASVG